jgi:DNA-binding response OmpR family regulator
MLQWAIRSTIHPTKTCSIAEVAWRSPPMRGARTSSAPPVLVIYREADMARATPGLLLLRGADGAQRRIVLDQELTTLGRSDACVVVIPAPTVSRLHAHIELQHDRYVIFDAGSANGTFVNGERITASRRLTTGDEVRLGTADVSLMFSDPEETLVALPSLQPDPLYIDDNARVVKVFGVPVQLSPLEYELLLHFASHPGTVCTRESSYLAVWNHTYDQATCEDALNACIAKLRRNLRQAAETVNQEPPVITTVQRVGFRLDTPITFVARPTNALSASA